MNVEHHGPQEPGAPGLLREIDSLSPLSLGGLRARDAIVDFLKRENTPISLMVARYPNHRLAGALSYSQLPGAAHLRIWNLGAMTSRKGVGSSLLRELASLAKEKRLGLELEPTANSKSFYLALGFRTSGQGLLRMSSKVVKSFAEGQSLTL